MEAGGGAVQVVGDRHLLLVPGHRRGGGRRAAGRLTPGGTFPDSEGSTSGVTGLVQGWCRVDAEHLQQFSADRGCSLAQFIVVYWTQYQLSRFWKFIDGIDSKW